MQLIDINPILFIDINDTLRNYKVSKGTYFDKKNFDLG